MSGSAIFWGKWALTIQHWYDWNLTAKSHYFAKHKDQEILNLVLAGFDPHIHSEASVAHFWGLALHKRHYLDPYKEDNVKRVDPHLFNAYINRADDPYVVNNTVIVHFAGDTKKRMGRFLKLLNGSHHERRPVLNLTQRVLIHSVCSCNNRLILNTSLCDNI